MPIQAYEELIARDGRRIIVKKGARLTTREGLQHIGLKVVLNKIAEAEGKPLPYPVIDDKPVPDGVIEPRGRPA